MSLLSIFKRTAVHEAPDPTTIAINVTLADLRQVASDLRQTSEEMKRTLELRKEHA